MGSLSGVFSIYLINYFWQWLPNEFTLILALSIPGAIIAGLSANKLLKDKDYLYKILEKGSKKADLIAKGNLKEIYNIVGLAKFS